MARGTPRDLPYLKLEWQGMNRTKCTIHLHKRAFAVEHDVSRAMAAGPPGTVLTGHRYRSCCLLEFMYANAA
jgi:hypothetical protein